MVNLKKSVKTDSYIERLTEEFRKQYTYIYDCRDNVPGYQEAIDMFDKLMKNTSFKDIVTDYCKYNHDCISSDREAAAFVFAVKALYIGK